MNVKLEAALIEKKLVLSLAFARIISSLLVVVSFTVMIIAMPFLLLMALIEWSTTTYGLLAVILSACAYLLFV